MKNTSQQIIVKRGLSTRTEMYNKTSNRTSSAHSIRSSNEVRIRKVKKAEERRPKREERQPSRQKRQPVAESVG